MLLMVTSVGKLFVGATLGVLLVVTTPLTFAQSANLGDLVLRFCNETEGSTGPTTSLSLEADENGVVEDICMYLSNSSSSTLTAKINFVDGTVTNDVDQKKACQPESTKERFGKFIEVPETEYVLAPGSVQEIHATAKFPPSYAGMAYGCVTYQVINNADDTNEANNGMFSITTRKASFIDVLLQGEMKLGIEIISQMVNGNLGDSTQLIITQDPQTGAYEGKIMVKNTGNIAQDITIGGSVQKWFTTPTTVESQTKKVLPDQTVDFIFPLGEIPLYKGMVMAQVDVTNTPVFDFQSSQITEEMKASKSQTLVSNMFLIPWMLLGGIVVILILLWIIATRKSSTHHTSTPTKKTPAKKSSAKTPTKRAPRKTTKKEE